MVRTVKDSFSAGFWIVIGVLALVIFSNLKQFSGFISSEEAVFETDMGESVSYGPVGVFDSEDEGFKASLHIGILETEQPLNFAFSATPL